MAILIRCAGFLILLTISSQSVSPVRDIKPQVFADQLVESLQMEPQRYFIYRLDIERRDDILAGTLQNSPIFLRIDSFNSLVVRQTRISAEYRFPEALSPSAGSAWS